MQELSDYLSITGIAHRRLFRLRDTVANDAPSPRDQATLTLEIACCEAIIGTVKATLASQHYVLEFSEERKARVHSQSMRHFESEA